jgi:hypothetical protein
MGNTTLQDYNETNVDVFLVIICIQMCGSRSQTIGLVRKVNKPFSDPLIGVTATNYRYIPTKDVLIFVVKFHTTVLEFA